MGQNIWPPAEFLPYSQFKEPVEAYFQAINKLSHTVMRMVGQTLPYGNNVFEEFLSNNPVTPLRLLHYPPRRETEKPQFGSSAHTDFGAITLLLQDQNSGLQVLEDGEWIPVPPNPEAYVVNIGDMLSMWTGGAYKSSMHRVLNENPHDRYSIVFFLDGNLDCKLAPLDGSAPASEVMTVEDHMLHRMAESYGKGKK
jgi:isopenicillin N synthase-like dioxygenase